MSWLSKMVRALAKPPRKSKAKAEPRAARPPRKKRRAALVAAQAVPSGRHVVGLGGFPRSIVGESFCQEALAKLCGGHNREGHELEVAAVLVQEPSNPYDPGAVQVQIDGMAVGYLSKDEAPRYVAALMEAGLAGQAVGVKAKIVGGWRTNQHDAGHFGVRLALPWPVRFN
jgi:hypothetical protein